MHIGGGEYFDGDPNFTFTTNRCTNGTSGINVYATHGTQWSTEVVLFMGIMGKRLVVEEVVMVVQNWKGLV